MNILFNKVRDVKNPERAYGTADAVDFFVPNYSTEFYNDLVNKGQNNQYCTFSVSPNCDSMSITIAPNGRVNIPSGIRVIIGDEDTCLLAVNKSGVAANKGLVVSACLVDHDYQGEIHLGVINSSDTPVTIKTGDKLMQFMHLPIIHSHLQEISTEDFYKLAPDSKRKSGGFGSSGAN